jgi:hypothetical protein
MKFKLSLLGFLTFFLSSVASAGVVHIDLSEQLPASGTAHYDLDGDSTNDIGLAEDCCYDETLWINGNGYSTQFQWSFVNTGDVIDGSLDWVSGTTGYTTDLAVGVTQYIATQATSIGDYFGYFAVIYDGVDTFLTDFWYEDTGAAITVGSVSQVPVPAAAFLFGPALLGFIGLRRKAKKA